MFIENKYTKWYNSIVYRAKSQNRKKVIRGDPAYVYYESHHIIPKSMGGIEEVLLTAKEHYMCHLLLPKMLDGKQKHMMINALIKMSFSKSKGQDRYVSRSFAIVRSMIAEKNSEMFLGKPKSEEAKQNMRGRSGTWKRTDKDKERMIGKNNPMFGKTGSNNPATRTDVKDKIRKARLEQPIYEWTNDQKAQQKERMKLWWKERKSNGLGEKK